jgi:hypothetical protein
LPCFRRSRRATLSLPVLAYVPDSRPVAGLQRVSSNDVSADGECGSLRVEKYSPVLGNLHAASLAKTLDFKASSSLLALSVDRIGHSSVGEVDSSIDALILPIINT